MSKDKMDLGQWIEYKNIKPDGCGAYNYNGMQYTAWQIEKMHREYLKQPKLKKQTMTLEDFSNRLYESKILHDYKDGKIDYRKIHDWIVSQKEQLATNEKNCPRCGDTLMK